MRISLLLPLVFLSLTGCIDVHEHPTPTADRDRCDAATAADHDLCHTGATWHLCADALSG